MGPTLTPKAHTSLVTDKTLDDFVKQADIPVQEFTTPAGTFKGFMGDSINPYFVVKAMDQSLYEAFNTRPAPTVKSMYLATDEPLAISEQLMNGASKKLTDKHSDQYLPNNKVTYRLNNLNTAHPSMSMLPANGSYNMIQFNNKDWEDF